MYFIRDYCGPKPYQPGSNPDVMIIGQDPTINQHTRFTTVLGFEASDGSPDRQSINLQNYIRNKILSKLGIREERILLTNLVNYYYHDVPNKVIAKRYKDLILSTAKKVGIVIDQYPDHTNGAVLHALNFECATRESFEKLLSRPSIAHLITLGEPVLQVMRERYNLELAAKIKDVLKSITDMPPTVQICSKSVSLLPLPHIFPETSYRWRFYKLFIDEALPRLSIYYQQ